MFCIGEREMASAERKESCPAISSQAAEEMAKYGITRVTVDYFHYGNFRYTNLKDAVAQAKRQQRQE
jgi:thiamine monophosphate synthase